MEQTKKAASSPLTFDLKHDQLRRLQDFQHQSGSRSLSDVVRYALARFDAFDNLLGKESHRQLSIRLPEQERRELLQQSRRLHVSAGEVIRSAIDALPSHAPKGVTETEPEKPMATKKTKKATRKVAKKAPTKKPAARKSVKKTVKKTAPKKAVKKTAKKAAKKTVKKAAKKTVKKAAAKKTAKKAAKKAAKKTAKKAVKKTAKKAAKKVTKKAATKKKAPAKKAVKKKAAKKKR